MGVDELGLLLAAVGALGVPPTLSIAIESGTSAVNGDVVAIDTDKRTFPLLVAESGGTLEDDLGARLQAGEVEGLASGDLDVGKSDGRARLLVGLDILGTAGAAERAAVALVDDGGSSQGRGSQCHGGEGSEEVHGSCKERVTGVRNEESVVGGVFSTEKRMSSTSYTCARL